MVVDVNRAVSLSDAQIVYYRQLPSVDITPPGHAIRITWAGVPGATRAEVTAATATIGSQEMESSLGDLPIGAAGQSFDVTVPGSKRIKSLTLSGLKKPDGTAFVNQASLGAAGLRLVVSTPGGNSPPLYSVPAVFPGGMLPPTLTGATFDNRVLALPGLAVPKIRLSLVTGDTPGEFSKQDMRLDSVSGVAAILPNNLQIVDPDGAVVWTFPNNFPLEAPPVDFDMKLLIQKAFESRLKANQPLDVTFHLRGSAAGKAGFRFSGAHGSLVRDFPGVITTQIEGSPQALTLPFKPADPPLANEQPASVTADLTIKYLGLRVLENFCDAIPAMGGTSGSIVTDQPVVRTLPPAALRNLTLARVGIIGRAPVDCELSLQVVDMSHGAVGKALGKPGVVKLTAADSIDVIWITLPTPINNPTVPVGISVHTNVGRFLWASGTDLLLRLAVQDPNPGGRALILGGTSIASLSQAESHQTAISLPASVFRSVPPTFDSYLFLKVDLSDLTLRYAR